MVAPGSGVGSFALRVAQTGAAGAVTADVLVVFAIVLLALVLFVTEWPPIDVTAILVMVLLMLLGPDPALRTGAARGRLRPGVRP